MSIGWPYSPQVMGHIMNPRNVGELENANAVGEVDNRPRGDYFRLSMLIENDRIVAARFLTQGCGTAIAASSMLTELLVGISLDEARRLTNQDINQGLGGLPPEKQHCSLQAEAILGKALADYESRRSKEAASNPARSGETLQEGSPIESEAA